MNVTDKRELDLLLRIVQENLGNHLGIKLKSLVQNIENENHELRRIVKSYQKDEAES